MTFQRPTLPAIHARVIADLNARLPGADATLRHSNLGVIAYVLAGASHGQHAHLDWLALQILPDTATVEYLERHADTYGVRRKLASLASGTVRVTGTDGIAIPAGTRVARADGVEFEVSEGGVIAAGQVDLSVQARQVGAAGNTSIGATLRLETTIAGADSAATALAEIAGGADAESDADLRARLLLRIQEPPQGGATHDYVQWALQVPGVTRVWVSPRELGTGTVTVRFMMDDARTEFDGVPQGDDSPAPTGDIALVHAHIDALRPVTAELFVVAPVLEQIDVTIEDLKADTAEVRAAIAGELSAMIFNISKPGGTIPISKIWEAISQAAGENSHRVTSPVGDIVLQTGRIGVLGEISYG